MIPFVVHQLWLEPPGDQTGSFELPADVQRNVSTWNQHHPTVHHRIWRKGDLDAELSNVNGLNVLEAVNLCRFPTMQSNLIRLSLLYLYGGFWSDLKNFVNRPFLASLADNDLVLVEHQPMPNPPPAGYLTNSFVGARPHNEFLFECLNEGIEGIKARRTGSLSGVTGLVLMNRVFQRRLKEGTTPKHHFVSREEAWSYLMKRMSASYQADGKHWSEMQKTASLYLDEPE